MLKYLFLFSFISLSLFAEPAQEIQCEQPPIELLSEPIVDNMESESESVTMTEEMVPQEDFVGWDGLHLDVRFLNCCESYRLFKTRRIASNFEVVHVSIHNDTPHTLFLCDHYSNRPFFPACVVFDQCQYNPAARAVAWCVASTFINPLLLVGAVVDSVCAVKNNDRLARRVYNKEWYGCGIEPGERRDGVIFLDRMCCGEQLLLTVCKEGSDEGYEYVFTK